MRIKYLLLTHLVICLCKLALSQSEGDDSEIEGLGESNNAGRNGNEESSITLKTELPSTTSNDIDEFFVNKTVASNEETKEIIGGEGNEATLTYSNEAPTSASTDSPNSSQSPKALETYGAAYLPNDGDGDTTESEQTTSENITNTGEQTTESGLGSSDDNETTTSETTEETTEDDDTTTEENSATNPVETTEDPLEACSNIISANSSSSVDVLIPRLMVNMNIPAIRDCSITSSSYEQSDSNELTIKWTIANPTSGCSLYYVNLQLNLEDCESSDDCTDPVRSIDMTDLSYTFKYHLEPCQRYEYKIFEFPSFLNATISEKFVSNAEYDQLEIQLEEFTDASGEKIRVTWNDTQYPLCQKNYLLLVLSQGSVVYSAETLSLQAITRALEPCDTYVISVSPTQSNNTLDQYGDTKNYTMTNSVPSVIRSLVAVMAENGYAISFNWLAPEVGSKCVRHYVVQAESEHEKREMNTTNTNYIFSSVHACVEYTIRVHSKTFDDVNTTEVSTKIRVPSRIFSAPFTPRIENATEYSAFMTTGVDSITQINYCDIQNVEFRCTSAAGNVTTSGTHLMQEVTGLVPYTDYTCTARVRNRYEGIEDPFDYSPDSQEGRFTTKEGQPDTPQVSLNESFITATSCPFEWLPPVNPHGIIKTYQLRMIFDNFSYFHPESCEDHFERQLEATISVDSEISDAFTFRNLLPSASYYLTIQAVNGNGASAFSPFVICDTLTSPSSKVENLFVKQQQQQIGEAFNKTKEIQWGIPCRANGKIIKFLVDTSTVLDGITPATHYEVEVKGEEEEFSFSTDDFLPDTKYKIAVQAVSEANDGGLVYGVETYSEVEMNAGLPELSYWNASKIVIEPSTTIAKLIIPHSIFQSDVGSVTHVWMLLAELGCGNNITKKQGYVSDASENGTLGLWYNSANEPCVPQYHAETLNDFSRSRNLDPTGSSTLTIGSDYCDTEKVCNGPLAPGKEYALTMRLFTRKGFSDTDYVKIKTEKTIPLFLITVSILSIMCVVFVIGFYITFRRTRALRKQCHDSPHDNKDISINEFPNFHRDMIENNQVKMKDEYTAIQTFSDNLENKTCIASVANEKLNRYSNISPFDYNRVVLNDDEFENDYINASYINGYHYPREYIAAQGPKPNTGHDFWRMVLQHRVESIVMLTSLIESNKVKCHEYFPKLNGQCTFANIKITCKSETVHSNFIKRIMEVEKDDVKHIVKHYYFTTWPDHGVPSGLIEFCKMFRSERQKPDGTIVVHCSAGVGRTGTFIALDIMMQRIKQERKINVFDLVKQLRSQRMKMVQTVDQYIFLYTSGLDLIEARRHQPKVFQNIALYLNELKLFNRLKKGSSTLRDNESSF